MDYFNVEAWTWSMAIMKSEGLLLHRNAFVYNGISLNFFTVITNSCLNVGHQLSLFVYIYSYSARNMLRLQIAFQFVVYKLRLWTENLFRHLCCRKKD